MRHQSTMCGVFVVGLALTACGVDDNVSPDEAMETGEGGEGGEDGEGPDYSGGNNGGGMDMDDEGALVEPTYPTAHPRIYVNAHKARLQASLTAGSPAATRFKATVDRWVGGADIWGFQVWNAALLGPLTGDPKYCAKAVAAVDAQVASEEALIASGQKPFVAGNSYLEIGGIVGDIALTYDWCFDVATQAQKTRWLEYANQAVWNVWHHTEAKWGSKSFPWTGWSTNNPSDNYYYSFMRATMLLGLAAMGEDTQADGWITQFRDVKILGQLVPTFDADLRGGGSREGTAYGTSMRSLFHLYDIWHATTGEKLQARTKHARQSLRAAMHQMVPTLDRFVPTGDQPRDKTASFYDYQRDYFVELIDMYPNDVVAGRAKSLLAASSLPQMERPEMMVFDFLYDNEGVTAEPLEEMPTDYFASGIGQVYSRSGWDRDATWLNFTAGAYTESHAHQDQGALMIFKGTWLAGDGVFGTSNGIVQDTTSHSIVRVTSGSTTVKQKVHTTSSLVALRQGADWLYAAADTTPAYGSGAPVSKMQREMVYLKPDVVVVYDRVTTGTGTSQIWQLATSIAPAISGTSATITGGGHSLKVQRLAPAAGSTKTTNMAGQPASGGTYVSGYRLDTSVAGGDVRYLHVLSLDGSVTSATANGDSTVTVAMANGQTATVAFDRNNTGATLTYGGTTHTLTAGVDELVE